MAWLSGDILHAEAREGIVKRRDAEGAEKRTDKNVCPTWASAIRLVVGGDKTGNSSLMLRMADEFGEPLDLCFFSFGTDDPMCCHPLVPGSLRTEEFPSRFVGAKLLFLFTSELGVLALFVGVDARLFCVAGGKSLETGGMHQPLLGELSNEVDVNCTPVAGGLAGSKTDRVAGFVDALSNAVDPAETECNLYGFGPGDAGLCRIFFVEAYELLAEFVVMGFEPGAEVGRCLEERWF